MDYSYNYNYLRTFMEEKKLAKKDLLEALGCSDYVSLNRWLDGKVPVHITAMLRFCNYYNIPLDGFFFDGDGIPSEIRPSIPDENSQTLPIGGYGIKEGRGRGIVETHISERKVSSSAQASAVNEGLARQAEQQRIQKAVLENQQQEDTHIVRDTYIKKEQQPVTLTNNQSVSLTERILRIKLEHESEMRQLERENHNREDRLRRECQAEFDIERNRLMDIIERQNSELSKIYAQTRHSNGKIYDYTNDENSTD